jgi:peptidoglycan hydrolase-like protein with peptidoglycan-binding domain
MLLVSLAIAGATAAGAEARLQVVGLQVALRAHGLYLGPIDGIYGPMSARALRHFQRQAGLAADGKVGPATRRAMGPLGRPTLGSRTEGPGALGWDVSITQFLLRQRGATLPINGYFGGRTARAVRAFQHSHDLTVDGIAGPSTLAALVAVSKGRTDGGTPVAATSGIRFLLNYWAKHYAVDNALVRALAWMESGYQANLTSPAGAWGVMQILPVTWAYVEAILIGRPVQRTTSGNIRVGVALLRELLNEFDGDPRRALAAWYQGPASLRKHGPYRTTRRFVANVMALKKRTI